MKTSLKTIPLLSALLMANSSISYASDDGSDNWYFSPMLSYIKADSDRQADDDFGVLLGFGKQVSDDWNIELSAAMDNLSSEVGSGEYKQRGLMVDGIYFFNRKTIMQTYAVVGAGLMSTDVGATDGTNPMINVGVGMMQQISDSGMKIRADIRYRMDMDDKSIPAEDNFSDMMLNVGVVIPFGDEHNAQPASVATSTKDSDNDGVADSNDRCPGTAAGIQVDNNGCQVVTKPVVAKVLDSDKDGVMDDKDQCLNTKVGVSVDTSGCELKQSFVLKGVNFVTGSNELTTDAKKVLDDVANTLNKNSTLNVEVAGYTDNRGKVASNQRLSQKRAESVTAYLVSAGVDKNRMIAKGYGEDDAIATNSTSLGRSLNRRVELHILN